MTEEKDDEKIPPGSPDQTPVKEPEEKKHPPVKDPRPSGNDKPRLKE